MFRDETSDGRKDSPEIGQIGRSQQTPRWDAELEDDQFGARFENPSCLPKSTVQIDQVSDPESHGRPIEPSVGKRKVQGIGIQRDDAA
jgi:hypothetical protein